MNFEAGTYRIEELIAAGLMEIGDGYRAKNSELSDHGIPFARAGNINDGFNFDSADLFPAAALSRVGNKVSRPGDVVFTSKGTVGRLALVSDETQQFVYSPQLCFWRSLAPNRLLPEYIYYWMKSAEFYDQVGYLKGQTDMADYVSLRDQRRITATFPETQRQRSIVGVVRPLDDRITLLRETNATLEAIAQALFKSWFVDFDPVRAKQEGRAPDGMDEATAALFPDEFEESELGLVPRGWRTFRLADVVERITKGTTPTTIKRPFVASGINFVKAESMTDDGQFIPEKFAFIDDETHALLKRSQLNAGDVLISIAGTIGRTAVMTQDFLPANTNQAVALIRPLPDRFPSGLISRFLKRSEIQQLMRERVVQAVQANLSLGTLSDMKVVVPPVDVVANLYNAGLAPIDASKVMNAARIRTLVALRDTLLPRLISGKLRLPEAEAVLEEVAA